MLCSGILELVHSRIDMVRMLVQMPIAVSARVCYLVEQMMNSRKTVVLILDSPDHCRQDVMVVVFYM